MLNRSIDISHYFLLFTLQKLAMKLLLLSWPHSFHQPLKSLSWQGNISSAPSNDKELRAASRSPSPAPEATWTRVEQNLCLASGPQPWYHEATTCIWVPARPWSPFMLFTEKRNPKLSCHPKDDQSLPFKWHKNYFSFSGHFLQHCGRSSLYIPHF